MSCDGLHIMFICFTIIISTNTSFPTLRIPTCMQETQLAKILVINSRLCNQNVQNIGLGQMLIWYIIRFFFFFLYGKQLLQLQQIISRWKLYQREASHSKAPQDRSNLQLLNIFPNTIPFGSTYSCKETDNLIFKWMIIIIIIIKKNC